MQNTVYRHILVGEDREEILVPTVFDEIVLAALQDTDVPVMTQYKFVSITTTLQHIITDEPKEHFYH